MKRNEKMLLKVFEVKKERLKSTKKGWSEFRRPLLSTADQDGMAKGASGLKEPKEEIIMSPVTKTKTSVDASYSALPSSNLKPDVISVVENITPESAQVIEVSVPTPSAPIYSPVTPIDRETFLSGYYNIIAPESSAGSSPVCVMTPETLKLFGYNKVVPDSSEGSSPVRAITPETLKLIDTLSEFKDFSDDDNSKDPDFLEDTDYNNSSSDESTKPDTSRCCRTLVSNPLKKRKYGNDLVTEQPIKKSKISASTSDVLLPESCKNSNDVSNNVLLQSNNNVPGIFRYLASKPLKRRRSEGDLVPHPIQKKSKRSVSISGPLLPNIPQKTVSNSPMKKHVSDPSKWKRNVNRNKRLRGEAYETIKGKNVAAASMKEPKCVSKLKHKCGAFVPQGARKNIYESFRSLESLEKQRNFIIQHVNRVKKKRCTTSGPSRKASTNQYSFTVSDEKVSVCRDFFLDTLNIKEGMVRGALKKITKEGILSADQRGKKEPANKLSSYRRNLIKDHIFSFPAMESHYCRKNSEYRYLDAELNVQIMYNLYKAMCNEKETIPACIETYRKIFRSYKLKFHVPKKDMCKKCIAKKELGNEMTSTDEDNYAKHLQRRDDAYLRRDADKEAAKADKKTLAFNFDLEAVLSTPKGASGPFYYARKLAVYNLTFYEFCDQDVDCYTWDETEGKRGSAEIATCVYKYILSAKKGVTNVRMMSDNCGGQQKNFNFSCMLLYLVTIHPTIETIDHVFFESGHSHMECDSVHSKIEQKCKNLPVYTPDGWIQVMRLARTNPSPFNVNVLLHDEFKDFNPNQHQFAEVSTKINIQKKKGKGGSKPVQSKTNFQDAVWIQYRKTSPNSIFIKTGYNDDNFKELKIKPKKGKTVAIAPIHIYNDRIPISQAKKKDLLKLCQENQIPRCYHSFYENLPDSETVADRLPEPDVDEDDETSKLRTSNC